MGAFALLFTPGCPALLPTSILAFTGEALDTILAPFLLVSIHPSARPPHNVEALLSSNTLLPFPRAHIMMSVMITMMMNSKEYTRQELAIAM